MRVTAFVRDPDSSKTRTNITSLEHIHVDRGDMSNHDELAQALKGFDSALIVTPGDQNRAEIMQGAVNACKLAKLKHILVVSVLTADKTDQIFGRQFMPIEEEVKSSGINYTLIRLPLFMDNNMAHLGSIRDQGEILTPILPNASFVSIALQDVGEACAKILTHPKDHVNKVYSLMCSPFTMNDMARAFADEMGKEVRCVPIPDDTAKQGFMAMGVPEWQADGIMQLINNINTGDPVMSTERADFRYITGRDALTIQQWAVLQQQMLHQEQPQATPTPSPAPLPQTMTVVGTSETVLRGSEQVSEDTLNMASQHHEPAIAHAPSTQPMTEPVV